MGKVLLLVICLLVAVPAYAEVKGYMPTLWLSVLAKHYKGQPVSTKATPEDMERDKNMFIWYVVGVSDANSSMGALCLPNNYNPTQLTDIVAKGLEDHPNIILNPEYSGATVAGYFLQKAYPCK